MKRLLTLLLSALLLLSSASAAELASIKDLNQTAVAGSHAADDYKTASLERNYRETVQLSSARTGHARYDHAYYPRVKKIRDDLYLLLYMYGELGPHLFWTTSRDGVKWENPQYLYNNGDKDMVHKGGHLDGVADRYCAVNADAVVLPNGEILCAYTVRTNKGYRYYPDENGMFLVRGTVSTEGTITWGEHKKIYTGSGWEPYIWQRADGRIEIYWSCGAYYFNKYGYDEVHRSGGTGLIWSDDGGYTWTPNVQAGDTNYYQPFMVFSQFVGNKVHTLHPELGELPYGCAQMPAAGRLYDGRTLLAAEVKTLDGKFTVGYTVSADGGVWEEDLQNGATTNGADYTKNFSGGGPYVAVFPSGEVYLTYHKSNRFYGRMGAPDGSAFDALEFFSVPSGVGMWGATEVVGSHEVITAAQKINYTTGISGIVLEHSYLNHRINAGAKDWEKNTDALFIGSESQAQMTVRAAHDRENVYFRIDRLDNYLTSDDTVTVCIGTDAARYYRVTVGMDGAVSVTYVKNGAELHTFRGGSATVECLGTLGDNSDTDEGARIDLALSKTTVGLVGKNAFKLSPVLVNRDGEGTVTDRLEGVSTVVTDRWPSVILD